MDSDFSIDLSEVLRNVESAEVLALFFPLLRKTLLVDSRTTELDPPLIAVVPMVATPDERFKSLQRLRPRLPRPESITFIPWPKYVGAVRRLGVAERLVRRFAQAGQRDAVLRCQRAFRELERLERRELFEAICGDNYESLWDAGGGSGEEGEREEK